VVSPFGARVVLAPVGFDDEASVNEKVDPSDTEDGNLGAHVELPVPQSPADQRLQPAVGIVSRERDRLAGSVVRALVQPGEIVRRDESEAQGGLQGDEELLRSRAAIDLPEHAPRCRPRGRRVAPVHDRVGFDDCGGAAVAATAQVEVVVVAQRPDPEVASRADARSRPPARAARRTSSQLDGVANTPRRRRMSSPVSSARSMRVRE